MWHSCRSRWEFGLDLLVTVAPKASAATASAGAEPCGAAGRRAEDGGQRSQGQADGARSGCAPSAGSGDVDQDRVVPGRAVGVGPVLERGLGVASLVGRPDLERVLAGGGVPRVGPLAPGVDGVLSGERGLVE